MFPGCTRTHTCTHIFPSPLEQPLSIFSLHSVQITSRWDKSIMFPEKPPPPPPPPTITQQLLHCSLCSHSLFFPPAPLSGTLCPKGHSYFIRGRGLESGRQWWCSGGWKGKQNLCNQQQDVHNRKWANESAASSSLDTTVANQHKSTPGRLEEEWSKSHSALEPGVEFRMWSKPLEPGLSIS